MGSGKQRWKISFHRSPSPSLLLKKQSQTLNQQPNPVPAEFLCPISGSIMADPVIVSSGHTFERSCVRACVSLSFNPTLLDGAVSDFSAVIPNLALRSTILNWCRDHLIEPPKPLDFHSADTIVRGLTRTPSSEESVTPLPLTTRPSCYSSSSSCDIEISASALTEEEEEMYLKLKSSQIHEQEDALASLRKLTRTREETRTRLCTPRLLSALKSLISSRYTTLQVNSVAALVNLSLEKQNKVKMVRSGIVPPLIDVLRNGSPESRDHAAGALFSLSLDDQNKTAIGVLGGLPPLLHALRSESERTRHDSSLALYHLSFVQSNRVKMVKLGAVQILLGMVRSGHMLSRVMLVLCNLAASAEGRAAMLDGGAVECFLSLLSRGKSESASVRESCLAAVCVPNTDQRGNDYSEMSQAYRPSHADATYDFKYGVRSVQGGGRSSARETIGRVAAGAVAKKILKQYAGTEILAYVSQVHNVLLPEDLVDIETVTLDQVESNIVRCPNPEYAEKMIAAIDAVRVRGDSVGGVVTCIVRNVPRGLGSPVFDKLEAELAKAAMSLPATKGFEFGSGFAGTFMTGSEHNDEFYMDEQGRIRTKTNRSGGIQGGISNGETINMRIAFKPTSTISRKQNTVTRDKHDTELIARGRHDPCVVPRAVPMVEAMVALVLVDQLMAQYAQCMLFPINPALQEPLELPNNEEAQIPL